MGTCVDICVCIDLGLDCKRPLTRFKFLEFKFKMCIAVQCDEDNNTSSCSSSYCDLDK